MLQKVRRLPSDHAFIVTEMQEITESVMAGRFSSLRLWRHATVTTNMPSQRSPPSLVAPMSRSLRRSSRLPPTDAAIFSRSSSKFSSR